MKYETARHYFLKRKKILIPVAILLGIFGLYIVNAFLTITLYNPAVVVPIYGWLGEHGIVNTKDVPAVSSTTVPSTYRLISIWRLQHNLFFDSHAAVVGKVTDVVHAKDGDVHLNIADERGNVLVAEMAPEYPLALPKPEAKVKIWGITRYDLGHRWWEIHPVFGWSAADGSRYDD